MARYFLLLIIFLTGCAEIVPLTGGEKDTFAPKPIEGKQTPEQGALGFFGNELSVTFDEYFKLQDPSTTITMNPKAGKIIAEQKKKTLMIRWDENLQANTTYIIQLNGTVKDINESNDSIMQFVFSTGLSIDSLSLKGLTINSFNSSPINNATIGLYESGINPYSSSPIYATRSNQKGEFGFSYLKPGNFQLFAFIDQNKNQQVEVDEMIGFSSNLVTTGDSSERVLRMFSPLSTGTKTQVKLVPPGLAILSGRTIDPALIKINESTPSLSKAIRSDSVLVALPFSENGVYSFTYQGDTLVRSLQKKERETPFKIKAVEKANWREGDTLNFLFNEWANSIDSFKIHVTDATGGKVPHHLFIKEHQLQLFIEKAVQRQVKVRFDQGAIKGMFANSDSISFNYRSFLNDDLSILHLNTTVLDGTYLIQLMDGDQVIMEQLKPQEMNKVTFTRVIPGNYSLRCVKDLNSNKKWDTGSFIDKLQPEEIIRFQLKQKLRANWEIEETLQLN